IHGLVKGETVLKTGTATALHEDSKLECRVGFFLEKLLHFCRSGIREENGGRRNLKIYRFNDIAHGMTPRQGYSLPNWFKSNHSTARAAPLYGACATQMHGILVRPAETLRKALPERRLASHAMSRLPGH